jgi:hypothetical protein
MKQDFHPFSAKQYVLVNLMPNREKEGHAWGVRLPYPVRQEKHGLRYVPIARVG